ncbi:MAG: MaoC family dehydratase [Solirubrobacteraceae bacterium]
MSSNEQQTGPTIAEGIDGVRALVGAKLGPTAPVVVEQPRIDAFADATEDHQWIHIDAERSAAGPFGATIAHGYLTLSLCAHFMAELLEVRGVSMAINYGVDRVRFPSPVPVGSALQAEGEVLAVDDVAGGVQSRIRITVGIADAPKPSCVAEVLVRHYA